MTFYSDIAVDADTVLKEFGAPAILRRVGLGSYEPFDAVAASGSPGDEPVTAVVLDYDESDMTGSLIQRSDKRVFMSAVGVDAPRVTDLLVWVDGTYTIQDAKVLAPSGVNVIYELRVRK